MTAILLRSAPISTAASRPTSGWPTIAACPPSAVTAATMLSGSDLAPDSTATVPRGNGAGSSSASDSGSGSKDSESGQRVGRRRRRPDARRPPFRTPPPSCDAGVLPAQRGQAALIQAHAQLSQQHLPHHQNHPIFECMFDTPSKHPPTDTVKRSRGAVKSVTLIDGDIDKCHHLMLYSGECSMTSGVRYVPAVPQRSAA